jgi:hypothetical protein
MNLNSVNKILNAYSNLENDDIIIRGIVLNSVIPVLMKLNNEQRYSSYLTVINFPERGIKNGEILLRKMLELGIIPQEYLEYEKTLYLQTLPEWVKKVLG